MHRIARRLAGVAVLCVAAAAFAAVSPLLLSASLSGTALSLATNRLPKGWFSSQNSFNRSKTDLRSSIDFAATTCSPAGGSLALSSATDGNFTATTGPQGQVTGYSWSTTVDLTSHQNTWFRHVLCDGTVQLEGCADSIPVTVTTTAYAADGTCHTYQDDSGATVCAADTQTVQLPAVQLDDVVETDCWDPECGIGECVSACQEACGEATYSGTAKEQQEQLRTCRNACECECKLQIRWGNPYCTIEEKCLP